MAYCSCVWLESQMYYVLCEVLKREVCEVDVQQETMHV